MLLLIEIADSSLNYDRALKMPLYARHGIPEFWIVSLAAGEVEVCRAPVGDRYTAVSRVSREGTLDFVLLPGTVIQAAVIFG